MVPVLWRHHDDIWAAKSCQLPSDGEGNISEVHGCELNIFKYKYLSLIFSAILPYTNPFYIIYMQVRGWFSFNFLISYTTYLTCALSPPLLVMIEAVMLCWLSAYCMLSTRAGGKFSSSEKHNSESQGVRALRNWKGNLAKKGER